MIFSWWPLVNFSQCEFDLSCNLITWEETAPITAPTCSNFQLSWKSLRSGHPSCWICFQLPGSVIHCIWISQTVLYHRQICCNVSCDALQGNHGQCTCLPWNAGTVCAKTIASWCQRYGETRRSIARPKATWQQTRRMRQAQPATRPGCTLSLWALHPLTEPRRIQIPNKRHLYSISYHRYAHRHMFYFK